jgi:hypothetical protein
MNTREQIILQKIIDVHGNKYSPNQIVIPEGKGKIQLSCNIHGLFELRLDHLLKGAGCQICSRIEKSIKIKESESAAFPQKAKEVHGDRYDYSKVDYQDYMTRVTIICKTHGEFTQAPRKHLEGSGCQKCGVESQDSKLNTEKFLERAREIHGDRYDYAQTRFVNSQTKLTITCRQHGNFDQLPHNHMKGVGCKKCADISNTKTTPEFIEQAKKVHKANYSYDLVRYTGFRVHVDITCEKHGVFKITPVAHLAGKGCQKCSIENRSVKQAYTTLAFIERAKIIHDNRWDYSKSNYVNTHRKVDIICEEHGVFEQTPASHLSGKGCPTCGSASSIESRKLKFSEFVERSKIFHEEKYIYIRETFVSAHVPMKIVCEKHGEFFQRPSSHMKGAGCPLCGYEKSDVTRTFNIFLQSFTSQVMESDLYDVNEMKKLIFIKTASEVHNYFYDYSKVQIDSRQDLVKIGCPIHGFFEQKAERHIYGTKCPSCMMTERRIQTEEFIEKAKIIHGGSYDYSKSVCNGNDSEVLIICKTHGDFQQSARGHLRGNGCRQCYVDSTKSSNEEFISKCKLIHNNKYSYDRTEYKTSRDSVIVTCSEHGDFVQMANDHKNGAGCPACAEYFRNLDNRDPNSPCVLYYIKFKFEKTTFFKIGITTLSTKDRFKKAAQYGIEIVEENFIETTLNFAIRAEQAVISEYIDYSFDARSILKDIGGGTECFSVDVFAKYNMELNDYVVAW